MNFEPLTIGAALPLRWLETYADWLREGERDLELQSFHTAEVLEGDWQGAVDEAKRLLDGFTGRLGIHGPFWGFTIHSMDPGVREVVTKRMMQGLDVCAALGATQMVIHSPYGTWDHHNLDLYPQARAMVIENTHKTLGEVVKRAENQGVELVIENIADKDPHDRRILAESFGSPAVKLSVDTGHAHWAHVSTQAPPVDYFVGLAGEMLGHVHLQDADGHADRHWSLGEGTIRWTAVFRALAMLETRPRLVLELRDHEKVPASLAHLVGLGVAR